MSIYEIYLVEFHDILWGFIFHPAQQPLMPNLSTCKKTGQATAHKRMKLRAKQDAEEARWEELEKQNKLKRLKEKKESRTNNIPDEKELIGLSVTQTETSTNMMTPSTTTTKEDASMNRSGECEPLHPKEKKRERNPHLSDLIGSSKKEKHIKISHASSVPLNVNSKVDSNAFDVLSKRSNRKKKGGNRRRNND